MRSERAVKRESAAGAKAAALRTRGNPSKRLADAQVIELADKCPLHFRVLKNLFAVIPDELGEGFLKVISVKCRPVTINDVRRVLGHNNPFSLCPGLVEHSTTHFFIERIGQRIVEMRFKGLALSKKGNKQITGIVVFVRCHRVFILVIFALKAAF